MTLCNVRGFFGRPGAEMEAVWYRRILSISVLRAAVLGDAVSRDGGLCGPDTRRARGSKVL